MANDIAFAWSIQQGRRSTQEGIGEAPKVCPNTKYSHYFHTTVRAPRLLKGYEALKRWCTADTNGNVSDCTNDIIHVADGTADVIVRLLLQSTAKQSLNDVRGRRAEERRWIHGRTPLRMQQDLATACVHHLIGNEIHDKQKRKENKKSKARYRSKKQESWASSTYTPRCYR